MEGGDSIQLFRFIRKFCQTIGVSALQPKQNRYHVNSMNWFTLFCLNQFFISTAAFLSFEASSMVEYGMTFLYCAINLICNILCLVVFLQFENISKYVGNWEQFIGQSEWLIYADLFIVQNKTKLCSYFHHISYSLEYLVR